MDKTLPAFLDIRDLGVTYPAENGSGAVEALRQVSFSMAAQDFVCVLGPSGSGKSTLLRVLAGLVRPTAGVVRFAGGVQPRVGMVFQQANLMPWRRALENITLPLELAGVSADEARRRALELVQLTGLQGFEATWPGDLSGGMAQRVALARALILQPDVLLLDEPFGALDALTRERMGAELLNLWQARRTTVVMVTHSISEALLLADRVLVFTPRPGTVELDLPVDIPRPRQEEVRFTPHFAELARRLRGAIG
jgi:NitT/TauT family transport system ATP-binding protein